MFLQIGLDFLFNLHMCLYVSVSLVCACVLFVLVQVHARHSACVEIRRQSWVPDLAFYLFEKGCLICHYVSQGSWVGSFSLYFPVEPWDYRCPCFLVGSEYLNSLSHLWFSYREEWPWVSDAFALTSHALRLWICIITVSFLVLGWSQGLPAIQALSQLSHTLPVLTRLFKGLSLYSKRLIYMWMNVLWWETVCVGNMKVPVIT